VNNLAAPDWPRVSEAANRAEEHLDAIRTLFFSIAEHVRRLALDQLEVRDRTQDVAALSVTDAPVEPEDASSDATDTIDAPDAQDVSEAAPRGPETLARTRALSSDQQELELRGGEIADALFVQAEEMGQESAEDAAPEASAERDRIRQAAEHVASAQLAMQDARTSLESESGPLAPAQDAQTLAIDELKEALQLLSPPPPPEESEQDESGQDQEPGQDESESEDESEGGEDQGASPSAAPEGEDVESMDDPSQLLQGVRDRDAERRRERDRNNQQRRAEPVDKDW
jgi:hypothetical protein